MSEREQLTGVALRRAVAEAVGWTWYPESCAASDGVMCRFVLTHITWEDAMAAAEAAGVTRIDIDLGFPSATVRDKCDNDYTSIGALPESLCRALLAALEAKKQ